MVWRWRWRLCRGALVPHLQLAGEAHGDGEGLRVMDLDVEAEGRLESRREQLHLLLLGEITGLRQQRLETLLELDDSPRALARRELAQRVGAQRRAKAGVEQLDETTPWRRALVTLNLHVPELGGVLQVVGCHPNLFFIGDPLQVEVGFTAVDER